MAKKPMSAVSWCATHRKQLFPTRKGARRAARLFPAEHKVAYECTALPGYFHVGSLPPSVIHGRITRDKLVEKVS